MSYYVDPEICNNCGNCIEGACKKGAIFSLQGWYAQINQWNCDSCGECKDSCERNAIIHVPEGLSGIAAEAQRLSIQALGYGDDYAAESMYYLTKAALLGDPGSNETFRQLKKDETFKILLWMGYKQAGLMSVSDLYVLVKICKRLDKLNFELECKATGLTEDDIAYIEKGDAFDLSKFSGYRGEWIEKYIEIQDKLEKAAENVLCKETLNKKQKDEVIIPGCTVSASSISETLPIGSVDNHNEKLTENLSEGTTLQTRPANDHGKAKKNSIAYPFLIASIVVVFLTSIAVLHYNNNEKGVNKTSTSEPMVESMETENAESQMTDEDIIKYIADVVNIDNAGYEISFKSNEPVISEDESTSIVYDVIPTSEYIKQNNLSITRDKNGYITRMFFDYTISDKMSAEDDNYYMNRNFRIITLILSVIGTSSSDDAANTFLDISQNADSTGKTPYEGNGYYLFYYEVQHPYQGIGRAYLFDIYMEN